MKIKPEKKSKTLNRRGQAQSLLLDEVFRTLRDSDTQTLDKVTEVMIEQAQNFDREGDRSLARELREVVSELDQA